VRQINPWLRDPVHQHSQLFTRADVEGHLPPELSIVECGRYNIFKWVNLGREPIFAASGPGGERLLPQDLSIAECGRSNINPRNPANSLPAWQRDLPSFIAGLNLLDDALTTSFRTGHRRNGRRLLVRR
jgi:hypothetical protein